MRQIGVEEHLSMSQTRVASITTVELHCLEHLWNHEKMFKTGVVELMGVNHSSQDRRHNRDSSLSFSDIKIFCVLSLESPH